MKTYRQTVLVMAACLIAMGRAAACGRPASGSEAEIHGLTFHQAALLAKRVYEPDRANFPEILVPVACVEDSESGLFAEIFELRDKRGYVDGCHLVVVIRGVEFNRLRTDFTSFSADARSAAAGGVPQWRTLEQPLLDAVQARYASRVTIIGHSMGGMIAQLAAVRLVRSTLAPTVTAVMFNSPGVSAILHSETPDSSLLAPGNLDLIHIVHQADPIPRVTIFGGHLQCTRWYLVRERTQTPHSVQTFLDYLQAHGGVLPEQLSVEQVRLLLSTGDEAKGSMLARQEVTTMLP